MTRIERLNANDLTTLATDHGQVPMNIAAVLMLSGASNDVPAEIARRLARIPRFRQRLDRAPLGGGRPYWRADPDFEVTHHISRSTLTDPLELGAWAVCQRLPDDRPLWHLHWCALGADRVAVVLVIHHVLADGMGGLAVLAAVADGVELPAVPLAAPPTRGELVRDAAQQRLEALGRIGPGTRQALRGLRELRAGGRPERLSATSLTRPTGSRRVIRWTSVHLAAVRSAAHDLGATVNDVVLAAVAGAMLEELASRGERLEHLIVSVPMSRRRSATASSLGNEVGVVPVVVPADLAPAERVRVIAARTAAAKGGERGSSAVLLGWLFRGLGAVRLAQHFVDRQRLVHTFETNLRGPEAQLQIAGSRLDRIVPVAVNPGNVCVSFDVLSYAGELGITLVMDPAAVPDAERLANRVRSGLDELVSGFAPRPPDSGR